MLAVVRNLRTHVLEDTQDITMDVPIVGVVNIMNNDHGGIFLSLVIFVNLTVLITGNLYPKSRTLMNRVATLAPGL